MTRLNIEYIPKKCIYCDEEVVCFIIKRNFFRKTGIYVCRECAKKIWQEETNRKLPQ